MLSVRLSRRGESGQVVVFFALLLPVLFGLAAIVMNIGNWYVHKRHLQTEVDAAVLAAAPSFSGCFFDQATANVAVAGTALSYAGDTARDPATTNLQVQEPNDVRVTLNSQRYWYKGDPTVPGSNGYGLVTDPVGDNSAGYPCSISSLDAKATDVDVPNLFRWLGIFPDIKAHAKVEIRRVRAEKGFLPLAVPEIDPNEVYAIFVDYAQDGTQVPIAPPVLLSKNPTYGGANFPYSAWVGAAPVTIHPNNTYSDGTGVVVLVSKRDTPISPNGSLDTICGQTLVTCYDGTGAGSGLSFIHSFRTSNGSPSAPLLRDVNLSGILCPGGPAPVDLSYPYFTNDFNDCTTTVTVKVDFGVTGAPVTGDPRPAPNLGGICAEVDSNAGGLTWQSTNGTISTWTGTMSIPSVGGHQQLTLSWKDKTSGTVCNSLASGPFPSPAAVPYSADDASGPVGYVRLTAGSGGCPAGGSVADANSVPRGDYCYTVAVGLQKPLALLPWNSPDILMRFASKSARKNGSGTANLNGSLLCDHGRTLADTFTTGCFTTYGLNYDKWGTSIQPQCAPGAYCWKDITCSAYGPNDLPPQSFVNNPPPICVAAKNGTVQAFEAGIYNRFEDLNNGYGGCTPNYWPTTLAEAQQFFKPVDQGGHDFTNDPRYITLIVTDNTAFSSPNTAEPVKYFAGFYATGWDTANGSGNPKGCFSFPPSPGTCGAPNNDAHPILGCLAGKVTTADNGDVWGHFVKFVAFSSNATPSDDLCALTSTSTDTCVAVLVE